ncbi:MAG: transketolase family protein, partial [Ruminococcaceae bacterium]|nr:transketolase family protein [Oscillospiraceae bacterium]
ASGRAFEQIRNTVAHPALNVKICASHAGITVGADGATHQCLEDIGIMRTIPNMVIINPADAVEAKLAIIEAAKYNGPVYMRFGRSAVPVVFDEATYKFEIGKASLLEDGTDVTIIASGITVEMALKARNILAEKGISASVLNIATIKPLDIDAVVAEAKKTGAIVTVEEHNIIGGLGSAVAEALSEHFPVPVLRVGIEDKFGTSGDVPELLLHYGLSPDHIAEKALEAIAKKK